MCTRCVDYGLRAYRDFGADDLPVATPERVAEMVAQTAKAGAEHDAAMRGVTENMGGLAELFRQRFGGVQIEILNEIEEDRTPPRTAEDFASVVSEMSPEFWRDADLIEDVSKWYAAHHPSGIAAGIPWDMLSGEIRQKAIDVIRDACYLREILRRMSTGLPPMPDPRTWEYTHPFAATV